MSGSWCRRCWELRWWSCLLAPASGFAQEKKGAFIDGEYVEDYVYVPDFISPEEVKKSIEAHSPGMVIVDTAAPPVWEDEHIPGAVNFPYSTRTLPPPCLCLAIKCW